MERFNFVVFGITSNLAQLKLIPSIFDLFLSNKIDNNNKILGLYRQERSLGEIKEMMYESVSHNRDLQDNDFEKFWEMFDFLNCDFSNEDDYFKIKKKLGEEQINKIYYLATHPKLYDSIFNNLEETGLNDQSNGWVRIMIEKPIGTDLKSAEKLNNVLSNYYNENQIFRIDHYLGKETIQNILAFRFNNPIFKDVLNNNNVDHIQVVISETMGIDSRSGYFDEVGNLRDMGQNHVLQMLAFATMEDNNVNSRFNLLNGLVPVPESLVLGNYLGYKKTDTYFAFKLLIGNGSLENVPVYVRCGKKMKASVAEISIVLKPDEKNNQNVLTYRIQPNEGIILKIIVKKPGEKDKLQNCLMQFCFKNLADKLASPYESLILNALSGDQTFFNNAAEVRAQWKIIDGLNADRSKLFEYEENSWGPIEADEMIRKDKREWIVPEESYCKI